MNLISGPAGQDMDLGNQALFANQNGVAREDIIDPIPNSLRTIERLQEGDRAHDRSGRRAGGGRH